MRAAEALAIGRIEWIAAVLPLLNVIGEHAMMRSCFCAALTIVDPLATEACVAENLVAPSLVLFGEVVRVGRLGRWLYCSSI